MFVYIDEAGHTGKNSADSTQPVFYYMAIASLKNIDIDLNNTLSGIKKKYDLDELHGVDLNDKLELFASDILKLLRSFSASFFVAVIEKNYLSYAKLYDTLFDNVENKGARFQTYQIRPFRLLIMSNLFGITPQETAHDFYENCLFANNEDQAIEVLIRTCKTILSNLDRLKDDRSKEIIGEALIWAKENPKEITSFNTRKIDRWRHLPHVVGFLPMLSMLSIYSKKHKSRINKIVHDEQQQVKKVLTEIHTIAADPDRLAIWDLRENGFYDLLKIKETIFDIKDSRESYGLQVVDVCLYTLTHRKRIKENSEFLPNTNNLLEYILEHMEPFLFTTWSFQSEVEYLHRIIMEREYSEEELQKGKEVIAEMEALHKQQKFT